VAKIKPEHYRTIRGGLKLEKLYLKSFKGEINLDKSPSKVLTVSISNKANFVQKVKNRVEISQEWNLIAKDQKSESETVSVSATYCLVLNSKEKFTKAFFGIYEKTDLVFTLWPFVREFVNSITARMNIPPLTLPFLKVPEKK
jgi:preprotein translocase subunit SecB